MQELKALIDKKTGKKVSKSPRFVKQDQVVIAKLQTAGVICVENYKDFPQMARFTLRDEGTFSDLFALFFSISLPILPNLQGKPLPWEKF